MFLSVNVQPELTSPSFLDFSNSLRCSHPSFLLLLCLSTSMEIFHDHSHEHVEDKESDKEKETLKCKRQNVAFSRNQSHYTLLKGRADTLKRNLKKSWNFQAKLIVHMVWNLSLVITNEVGQSPLIVIFNRLQKLLHNLIISTDFKNSEVSWWKEWRRKFFTTHLYIYSHRIQPRIHYAHPSVF